MEIYSVNPDHELAQVEGDMLLSHNPVYRRVMDDIIASLCGDNGLVIDIIRNYPTVCSDLTYSEDGIYIVGFKVNDTKFIAFTLKPVIYERSDAH